MARLDLVRPRAGARAILALSLTLIACALLMVVVLMTGASPDVANSPASLLMYVAGGLAWLRIASVVFPFLGLSPRDDLFERRTTPRCFRRWRRWSALRCATRAVTSDEDRDGGWSSSRPDWRPSR
jgi:hypothetical protein